MAVRKMPQNLEAEMSVLGVAFLDKNALSKICEELTADMFYSDQNKKIFEALKSMHEMRIPVDITTITEELDKKKNLSAIGGVEYLSEIIDSVATAANLDYYIKIVKDKAVARFLIDTSTDIATSAYDDSDDITRLLDNAEMSILNVVKARRTSEFATIEEVLKRAREQLDFLAKNKSSVSGLPTGFKSLDRATTGFHDGEVIIIAARPGMGKTAFSLNLAVGAAKSTKKAIAIFNLEMPAEQLVNRMISANGAIDGRKLQTGQLSPNDWTRYYQAVAELSATNIYIEDNSSITVSDIRAKCRRLAQMPDGLGLVLIDYLQLVTLGGKRPDSRQQEVQEISRSLKLMALELNVPVIALAQLNRSSEKSKTEPMLADLRESGSIEQDADIVMFINREDYYKAKEEFGKNENSITDIIIAKHRKGGTGKFQLMFQPNIMNFTEIAMSKESEYNE